LLHHPSNNEEEPTTTTEQEEGQIINETDNTKNDDDDDDDDDGPRPQHYNDCGLVVVVPADNIHSTNKSAMVVGRRWRSFCFRLSSLVVVVIIIIILFPHDSKKQNISNNSNISKIRVVHEDASSSPLAAGRRR
jgi:hypothetical protein